MQRFLDHADRNSLSHPFPTALSLEFTRRHLQLRCISPGYPSIAAVHRQFAIRPIYHFEKRTPLLKLSQTLSITLSYVLSLRLDPVLYP